MLAQLGYYVPSPRKTETNHTPVKAGLNRSEGKLCLGKQHADDDRDLPGFTARKRDDDNCLLHLNVNGRLLEEPPVSLNVRFDKLKNPTAHKSHLRSSITDLSLQRVGTEWKDVIDDKLHIIVYMVTDSGGGPKEPVAEAWGTAVPPTLAAAAVMCNDNSLCFAAVAAGRSIDVIAEYRRINAMVEAYNEADASAQPEPHAVAVLAALEAELWKADKNIHTARAAARDAAQHSVNKWGEVCGLLPEAPVAAASAAACPADLLLTFRGASQAAKHVGAALMLAEVLADRASVALLAKEAARDAAAEAAKTQTATKNVANAFAVCSTALLAMPVHDAALIAMSEREAAKAGAAGAAEVLALHVLADATDGVLAARDAARVAADDKATAVAMRPGFDRLTNAVKAARAALGVDTVAMEGASKVQVAMDAKAALVQGVWDVMGVPIGGEAAGSSAKRPCIRN